MIKKQLKKIFPKSLFLFFLVLFSCIFSVDLVAQTSPLATGVWRKVLVKQNGMYQISGATMKSWGWNTLAINPATLKVFGNHGGMLPAPNSIKRPANIEENAIIINDGGDGVFNDNDYISFYGASPHKMLFDSVNKTFYHETNIYSDVSAYFITFGGANGKRISTSAALTGTPDAIFSTYNYTYFYEQETYKLMHSGRVFHGEEFKESASKTFVLNVVSPIANADGSIKISFAGKGASSSANFLLNGQQIGSVSGLAGTEDDVYSPKYTEYANKFPVKINAPNNSLQIFYNKAAANSVGYLNYIEFFTEANLVNQGFFEFSKIDAIGKPLVQYNINNGGKSIQVLDITNPLDIVSMPLQNSGGSSSFLSANGSGLKRFVCIDWSTTLQVIDGGNVGNQNLAGLSATDLIIIVHPSFAAAAERLANHRRTHDGLSVNIVTPEMVYNEYSSGTQDITAIRDFMRKLYGNGSTLKYLLLFGDASYDYKNRVPNNTNFVPTYESEESSVETYSYCSDDYYGFLSDEDGAWVGNNQRLEISVGRLPVSTIKEANEMVDKLIRYDDPKGFGSWRNTLTFLADDVDESWDTDHILHTEQVTNHLDANAPIYNTNKIYMDAYKEVLLGGSGAYPDVNRKVDEIMNTGTLVFNYIGHGGSAGMSKERVVTVEQIKAWENSYNMPVFITATCELTGYDNPALRSAGEHMLLNPKGGPIALLTTNRVVYSAPNQQLITGTWFNNIADDTKSYRIGDVYMRTKNRTDITDNDRRFVLIGDPSMKLARPQHKVILDSINGTDIKIVVDTIKALTLVEAKGHLEKSTGGLWADFNGEVEIVIYDKPIDEITLGNGENGQKIAYKHLKSIIYKGKAIAENGYFSFSFIVPKDINYNVQKGKFSFYGFDKIADATGYNADVYVGGSNDNPDQDDLGPQVKMFMNTRKFINGGTTDENPYFIADLYDDHGINLSLSGIGRTLMLTVDGGTEDEKQIVLNDYYLSKTGTYKEGSLGYQFNNLKKGRHSLHLKVWDTYNNSAEGELYFIVGEPTSEFKILGLRSVPNPFRTAPKIAFDHNRPGTDMEIKTELFAANGISLLQHTQTIYNTESSMELAISDNENWVNQLSSGVYILRITTSTSNGETRTQTLKIVYTP